MVTSILPLQVALPGAIELLIVFLIFLLLALVPAILVYRDAKKRGMNAALWAVIVGGLLLIGLLPGLAALVFYLWRRKNTSASTAI